MDTKQLDELEAMHGKATQGEWLRTRIMESDGCPVVPHEDHDDIYRMVDGEASNIACANLGGGDGELIVAMRNALPSLISQAREAIALRDENERLRAEVAELEARNASQHDLLHRCWKAGSGYFVEAGEYRNGIQPPFEEWIAAALAPTPEVQR